MYQCAITFLASSENYFPACCRTQSHTFYMGVIIYEEHFFDFWPARTLFWSELFACESFS